MTEVKLPELAPEFIQADEIVSQLNLWKDSVVRTFHDVENDIAQYSRS